MRKIENKINDAHKNCEMFEMHETLFMMDPR